MGVASLYGLLTESFNFFCNVFSFQVLLVIFKQQNYLVRLRIILGIGLKYILSVENFSARKP